MPALAVVYAGGVVGLVVRAGGGLVFFVKRFQNASVASRFLHFSPEYLVLRNVASWSNIVSSKEPSGGHGCRRCLVNLCNSLECFTILS